MSWAATPPMRRLRRGRRQRVRVSEERYAGFLAPITGHRFYNPDTGRWLNRDPLTEEGFRVLRKAAWRIKRLQNRQGMIEDQHLYLMLSNDPMNDVDPIGNASAGGVVIIGGIVVSVCVATACALQMSNIRDAATRLAERIMRARLGASYDPLTDGPNVDGNVADALQHCLGACEANQNPGACMSVCGQNQPVICG